LGKNRVSERGIAVRVDHTKPADVKKLVASIKRRNKGLDILVNDVWGGDALTEFGSSWALAREYGFTDLDGTRPHWGNYARKKYGKYKICDERFYSYWVPGLVELIFPDWF
jgi:hypothetical protein